MILEEIKNKIREIPEILEVYEISVADSKTPKPFVEIRKGVTAEASPFNKTYYNLTVHTDRVNIQDLEDIANDLIVKIEDTPELELFELNGQRHDDNMKSYCKLIEIRTLDEK